MWIYFPCPRRGSISPIDRFVQKWNDKMPVKVLLQCTAVNFRSGSCERTQHAISEEVSNGNILHLPPTQYWEVRKRVSRCISHYCECFMSRSHQGGTVLGVFLSFTNSLQLRLHLGSRDNLKRLLSSLGPWIGCETLAFKSFHKNLV